MENDVQKLEKDVLEAETRLLDKLVEDIDTLSDEYIRMTLIQIKLGRKVVRLSKALSIRMEQA